MTKKEPVFFKGPSTEEISRYAELSGDHNKIHLDDEFARQAGLNQRIVHGMLSMGIAASALEAWGYPQQTVKELNSKFKGVLYPDENLMARIDEMKKLKDGRAKIRWTLLRADEKQDVILSAEATLETN